MKRPSHHDWVTFGVILGIVVIVSLLLAIALGRLASMMFGWALET